MFIEGKMGVSLTDCGALYEGYTPGEGGPGDMRSEVLLSNDRRSQMVITLEQLLAELNNDLEWEYAALIQYTQHAAAISGAEFDSIQKELLIHAQQELQHANMVSEQIDFLGGVPTIEVELREISPDSTEMLRQDLKGEDNAIKRYKQRIAEAEALHEYGLRRVLEDILIQEEEHKRDLVNALAKK